MSIQYLFTYGTLCRGFNNSFSSRLKSSARFIDTGCFIGRLFEIDRFPGAVKSLDGGYQISGEIYQLIDGETTLSTMDTYEECSPEYPEPTEYIRKRIVISTSKNGVLPCWVYLYNWSIDGLEEITTGDYYSFYCSRYGNE